MGCMCIFLACTITYLCVYFVVCIFWGLLCSFFLSTLILLVGLLWPVKTVSHINYILCWRGHKTLLNPIQSCIHQPSVYRTFPSGLKSPALRLIAQCTVQLLKGFYSKWVKSSFEHFITTQTHVGSTNGWIISQNTEILKFYFSTFPKIFGICDVISRLRLRWMCP